MLAYKKLEYIQTSGAQYINTGIAASSNIRWELTIDIIGTATQYQGVWDSLNLCTGWQGGYVFYCNNNIKEYGIKGNGKYKFILQNGYQGYDNTQVSSYGWGGSGYQIFIGRCNANWSGGALWCTEKIYRSTLYQGDKLVQDLIPVKRLSDNKVCMYDLVTNQFYTGSGIFTAGPEILDIKLLKINGLVQPKINGKKVYLFNGEQTHYEHSISGLYTFINYIEGTGTQWIDTGIQPITTTKIATKCSFSINGGKIFIGATGLPDDNDFRIFRASGQYLYFDRGGGRLNNSLALNTVYELEFGNWYIKINGQTVQSGNAFNIGLSSSTIKVMPTTNSDYGRIYYLKIYDGDTLVRDFIPTKRNSDNEIGLYDKVTKQFFANQGTGTFIGG